MKSSGARYNVIGSARCLEVQVAVAAAEAANERY